MTIRDLQKQLGQLNLLVEEAKQQEKQAKLKQIAADVKEYGITEVELRLASFRSSGRRPPRSTTIQTPAAHGLAKAHDLSGSWARTSTTT